jgi:hypothetical protein
LHPLLLPVSRRTRETLCALRETLCPMATCLLACRVRPKLTRSLFGVT